MTEVNKTSGRVSDSEQQRSQEQFTEPVGSGEYEVRQGKCISSIAKRTGHFWKTIWDDPANNKLRETRGNPSILLPGDRVHIPEIRTKEETGAAENRHRFRRRGEPATFKMTFRRLGVPRANEPYQAIVDGRHYSGTLDDQGKLRIHVPSDAERATIIVGEDNMSNEYIVLLHHLNPVDHETGIQQRLNNLGYPCEATGEIDEQTQAAMKQYQKKHQVAPSGRCDASIRNRLKQEHIDV